MKTTSRKNARHWRQAWTIAILAHILIFAGLALFLKPDHLVRVVKMTPQPEEVVNILPTQALRPVLFFSEPGVKLSAIHLCRVDEENATKTCYNAQRHAEHEEAVVFDPIHDAGLYELVVDEDAFDAPYQLDGERQSTLPSGDGQAGGAFVAPFELRFKAEEVLTASVFDATKPLVNEEMASRQEVTQVRPPSPPKKPTPHKPTPKPPRPKAAEVQAPQPSAPDTTPIAPSPEPEKIKLTPEMLQISPMTMAPTLLHEAANTADEVFKARDRNDIVEEAALAQKRFNSAYRADGPTVGVGQQGNAINHDKDVAEYLALMHKEIHPRWGEGYLIRLDTIYRSHDIRLQNSDLEAEVEITLDSLGNVSDVVIVRSSGVTDYDAEAISVAWMSSPKIIPPQKMLSKDGKVYIHWTFWRDTRQCGVFGVKVFKLDHGRRDDIAFDLKKVQAMEKKLGLTPSGIAPPATNFLPQAEPNTAPEPQTPPPAINPLDDL